MGVTFNRDSAERIAEVVRRVEAMPGSAAVTKGRRPLAPVGRSPVTASYDSGTGVWAVSTSLFIFIQTADYQYHIDRPTPLSLNKINQTFTFTLSGSSADVEFRCVSNVMSSQLPAQKLFWYSSGATGNDATTKLYKAPMTNSISTANKIISQVGVFRLRLESGGTWSVLYPSSGIEEIYSVSFCFEYPNFPLFYDLDFERVYTPEYNSVTIPKDNATKNLSINSYGVLNITGDGEQIGAVKVGTDGNLVYLEFERRDRVIGYKDTNGNDAYLYTLGGVLAGG